MNIQTFYSNISKQYCPKLSENSSKTIKEFFDTCIEPNLPKKETIIGWDKLLDKYVNDPEAIFFVRKYGSASNKNWNNIRRGFLTKFLDGFQYVYVDNFYAHYIYLMAINNYVPEYSEFKSFILSRQIPYGFMQTSEENPHQAFPKGKTVPLNTKGWKLAHLYSVNENYTFDYKTEQDTLFPLGDITEWKIQGNYDYPIKLANAKLSDTQKNWIKAHFIRFVHPINYFLVPKQKSEQDEVNNNIGEYEPLITYVYQYMQKNFPTEMAKFEKQVFAQKIITDLSEKDIGNKIINIKYGLKISKTTTSIRTLPYEQVKPRKLKRLPSTQDTKTKLNSSSGNFLDGFADFCVTPEIGRTGKGKSYEKAIQYLCEFLNIDLNSFTKEDLALIKSKENDIKTKYSDFYNAVYIDFQNKGRLSYLTSGYIQAALPYFYEFCNQKF